MAGDGGVEWAELESVRADVMVWGINPLSVRVVVGVVEVKLCGDKRKL